MAEFRVYKPRLDQSGKVVGAATKWEANIKEKKTDKGKPYKELEVFLTGTLQKGTGKEEYAVFDWVTESNPNGKQVTMKLDDPDIGELLALFNLIPGVVDQNTGVVTPLKQKLGAPGGSGLFHKNAKGNTTLAMSFMPSADKTKYDPRFTLRLSSKTNSGLVVVEHALTMGEAVIIKNLLEAAIRTKYGPYAL